MNWLIQRFVHAPTIEWVATLAQPLAWPAATIIVAAMFRAEVRTVLERLVRLKYHDFEAQFRRDLRETEELAAKAAPRRLLDLPSESRRLVHEMDGPSPAGRPSNADPRALIADAWTELRAMADRVAGTVGSDPVPTLSERGHLAGASLLLYERLRRLHDEVAARADWSPTLADADRFRAMARPLVARLAATDPSSN